MRTRAEIQRRAEPSLLARLLHLLALSAGAIAAPMLAQVGGHPAFFAAFGARGVAVWALALTVVFVPPLVLWAAGLLAGLVHPRLGFAVHVAAIGLLGAVLGLLLARSLEARTLLSLVIAVLVAGGITAAYVLLRPVRHIVAALAWAPLLVLALFVLASPAGSYARGQGNPAGAAVTPANPVPVVMVEFDEFPAYSLEDRAGRIDAARFPNFARLAATSTWYRHYTPVYDETTRLSASILTGDHWKQHAKPWFGAYPRNLYALLGRHYQVTASEEATDFCSPRICARSLIPLSSSQRYRHLLHGSLHAFLRRLAPPRWARRMAPADPALRNLRPQRKNRRKQVLDNLINGGRIPRWDEWVDSIGRRRDHVLYFKHSLLPHTPWQYLPDGRAFRRDPRHEPIPGFGADQGASDPWLMVQEEQRHLLQTRLADRMLGFLLDRLRRQGVFDRALVIVTADHGQAFFDPGANRHVADDRTWPQLATAPLFIHYPGQRASRVSFRRFRTYDFVPTIADVVGARIPWRIDGRSVLDRRSGVSQDTVTIAKRAGGQVTAPITRWSAALQADLRHQISLFGTGDHSLFAVGPRPGLWGRRVDSLRVARRSRLTTPLWDKTFYADVRLRSPFVPANVAGRIDGASLPRGLTTAVAVNGVIAATGRTVRVPHDRHAYYTMMVPPSRFHDGRNRVEVYLVRGATLVRLGGT